MPKSKEVTADEVLELRKKYKRAKQQFNFARSQLEEAEVAPEKKKRTRARRAERTEKEKANDDRLRALTARAKEIRAADASLKWTDAVKKASQEMKSAQ